MCRSVLCSFSAILRKTVPVMLLYCVRVALKKLLAIIQMAKCIKISSKLHSNCSLNHVSTSNNIFSRPGANLKLFFPFFFVFFFGGDMKFF